MIGSFTPNTRELDIEFNKIPLENFSIESPISVLTTDVAYFLPKAVIIAILPSTTEELDYQLRHRELNEERDKRIRSLSVEIEKEHIVKASSLMEINRIIPIPGIPQNTLFQINKLMQENMAP